MGSDTHIRVSEDVKEKIERQRRKGESYNDALNRLLGVDDKTEQFMAGFGAGADTDRPEKIRKVHEHGGEESREHARAMAEDDEGVE